MAVGLAPNQKLVVQRRNGAAARHFAPAGLPTQWRAVIVRLRTTDPNTEYWAVGPEDRNGIMMRVENHMKRKLHKDIRCYFDKDRFALIPVGDTVELTSVLIDGRIRVHWSGSTEGMGFVMGFVMVDQEELESCSDPE